MSPTGHQGAEGPPGLDKDFVAHLTKLTGHGYSAPDCLLLFCGVTTFGFGSASALPSSQVDAELAAWAFNNCGFEALDGLLRLQGRYKYIVYISNRWWEAGAKNDPRFAGVNLTAILT